MSKKKSHSRPGRPPLKSKNKGRLPLRRRGRPPKKPEEKIKFKKYSPKILRGMQDILPTEQHYWDFVVEKAISLAKAYGFEKIETPILEEKILFTQGVGLTTDIVEKQMYAFLDRGGDEICLRPEVTASVCRAYIEHGMNNLPQPVKLFYFGPLFRYERPQAGRSRQFFQFGLEVLGSEKPVTDAQIILFTYVLFKTLGINVIIQINSIGCLTCRKIYRKKLVDYLKSKRRWLCSVCQDRLERNPLRILDCKEMGCQEFIIQAPQIVDYLCDTCRDHFVKVLEYLDEVNVPYSLNPYLVRGLDYYTKTVFEVQPVRPEKRDENLENPPSLSGEIKPAVSEEKAIPKEIGSQSALGGGGRYDNLIEMMGGRSTPACGVAFGIERIVEELKIQNSKIPKIRGAQLFIAALGETANRRALKIFEELRQAGFRVAENLAKESLKTQLEIADKLGVKLTLILGQQEVIDQTVIIRDMASGNQEIIDQEKLIQKLRKIL